MAPNNKYKYKYEHLSTYTAKWLLKVANDTKVNVESICWYNKHNPHITIKNVMIEDKNEAYYGEIVLASSNRKKILFVNYVFNKRRQEIKDLYHLYNLKGKQK